MIVRIASLDEPIPGYRLLEPLGRGGFGEVWKAEAPGGLLKAIKLVHGTLASAVGGEEHVQKELRSLDCVKSVRHPFILSLDRYDVVMGQLLIVMELADRNLWQRFEECKKEGLPGVPRDELLHYAGEAAEALDVMNQRYGLMHSDVKPQNLFLVHNHIKVADFGLVRDMAAMAATAGNGVSPLYAAPETFHGTASRHSDQYSLAVVYQELLTGQRPFEGTNARQLMMNHVAHPPDLTPLPPGDRAAVRRALAKDPQQRFPSCGALIDALRGDRARLLRAAGVKPAAPPERRTAVARPHAPNTGLLLEKPATAQRPGMVLAVRCPSCGFTGQVPLKFQGRPVKCRACGQVFPVTGFTDAAAAAPAPAPEAGAEAETRNVVPEIEVPTSTFLEVECPACGNSGPVPEAYRGRRLRCRQCGCVHRESSAPADAPAAR